MAAILTLGLGIGTGTAIFTIVNGVLLRPLPFDESGRLVFLPRSGTVEADISVPDGRDLRGAARTLQDIALFLPSWAFDLTGDGEPERINGSVVEPRFFEILRAAPVAGRALRSEDDVPGGERVAVISEGLWERRFGRDRSAVGAVMTLSDHPTTIVGVMPEEVDFLALGVDVWVPVAVETPWALEERGTNNFEVIGRLSDGIAVEEARSEVRGLSERLAEEYPATNRSKVLDVVPLREFLTGGVHDTLWVLFAAVALLLLIGCINLAGLLLVQVARRAQEVAIRMALGGDRNRIARHLLLESISISMLGGALGTLLAWWGTDLLLGLAPEELPRAAAVHLDLRVLAFAVTLSLATGVLFGTLPAFHALRGNPARRLGSGAGRVLETGGRNRLLGTLVAAEVAVALVLLVGSGLLARSYLNLSREELGFRPAGVIVANIVLPESRYGEAQPQSRAFAGIVEALAAAPGMEQAAFVIGPPLTSFGTVGHSLRLGDRPPPDPGATPSARSRPVIGDYFGALGIPILAGRRFTPQDDDRAERVAIVNQRFARRYWPDEDPIGKRLAWMHGAAELVWMTVVGVAADVKSTSIAAGDSPAVYTPYLQRDVTWQRFGTLVVRTPLEPAAAGRALREAVWSVDPTVPIPTVVRLTQMVRGSLAQARFQSLLLTLFAAAALGIAVQGLYGMLSYVVAGRRREIGVRMALGARAADVIRLVLRRGLGLTLLGLGAGLAISLAATRLLVSLLFGMTAVDATTYAITCLLLLLAAAAACWFPALRASRLDPAETLRRES